MRLASTRDDTVPLGSTVVDCTAIGWSSYRYSAYESSGKNLRTVSADSPQLSCLPMNGWCGAGARGNQISAGTGWPRWQV